MSKVTIKFKLPKERDEFILATKGGDYYSCLWELAQYLREEWKYEDKKYLSIEETRAKFYNILEDHNINLDEIA